MVVLRIGLMGVRSKHESTLHEQAHTHLMTATAQQLVKRQAPVLTSGRFVCPVAHELAHTSQGRCRIVSGQPLPGEAAVLIIVVVIAVAAAGRNRLQQMDASRWKSRHTTSS